MHVLPVCRSIWPRIRDRVPIQCVAVHRSILHFFLQRFSPCGDRVPVPCGKALLLAIITSLTTTSTKKRKNDDLCLLITLDTPCVDQLFARTSHRVSISLCENFAPCVDQLFPRTACTLCTVCRYAGPRIRDEEDVCVWRCLL